jgi:predicted metallo-beta-lactamase superfamily hydrolase
MLILDHHLLRSLGGYNWLKELAAKVENRVLCAAEFMGKELELLEAQRKILYEKMPVPPAGMRPMQRVRQALRNICDRRTFNC